MNDISMSGNHNLIPRYFQVCYISIKYRARCTVYMKKFSILNFTHVSNYTLICFRKPKKVTSDFPIDFKFQHSTFFLLYMNHTDPVISINDFSTKVIWW